MDHVTRRFRRWLVVPPAALLLALGPVAAVPALAAPPGAVGDAYTTDEDTPLVVDAPGVLANDGEPGADKELCVTNVDDAGLTGSVVVQRDGSFTYTPPANFNGAGSGNSFTYTMYEVDVDADCEGNPGSTATVEITVNSVNDAPSASADAFQALKNTTLNIGAPGVLSNDSDIDGDSLTAIKVNNPTHGSVYLESEGSFSYTPANNYLGTDTFSYYAFDGEDKSPTRVVTITVSSIPPIVTPSPIPTPSPTPTPEPTLTPILTPPPEGTLEPGASPSPFVPPTAQVSGLPTAAASDPSLAPGQTPQPGQASDGGAFGSPLTILLGVTLLALIFGVAAAMYGPGWLERRRNRAG